jgi:uncharacterized membrane protein (UPF0127 family)
MQCARAGLCSGPDQKPRGYTSPGEPPLTHFLLPLTRSGGPPLLLRNERTGLPVATILETAFDSAARKRGLLGRDALPPGHALIIAPTNLLHTFFMRFAIDILFVTRAGIVAKASPSVPARRIVGAWRGFAAIEMRAGELARSGTRAGDRVVLVEAGTTS